MQVIVMNLNMFTWNVRVTQQSFGWILFDFKEGSGGFSRQEISRIHKIIEQRNKELMEAWNDYFNG